MTHQFNSLLQIGRLVALVWLLSGCSFTQNLFNGESDADTSSSTAASTVTDRDVGRPREPVAAEVQVISPQIDRRDIVVPKIDTEDFELGVYAGILSLEDFSSESVLGGRLAYHITEDFFFELSFAQSEVADTNFRRFGIALFPQETQDVSYYDASIGYKLLPGEVFILDRWAFSSDMYLKLGAGNTEMAGEDFLTYNIGFGLRVLPTDWLSLRLEAVDHIFETDLLGESKFTNNFEFNLGVAFFF